MQRIESQALFAKHLAVMLGSGLVLTDALPVLIASANRRLKKSLVEVIRAVESGSALSTALGEHPRIFSRLLISAVYAGERSGNLSRNLAAVALTLEKERRLVGKVKGALTYPLTILGAAIMLGLGLAFFVLPKITRLFEGLNITLPWTTRTLIYLANLIDQHGGILLLSIVSFVVLIITLFKQKFAKPAVDWLLLHVLGLGSITRNTNLSRFAEVMGSLLRSGVSIDESLLIAEKVLGNYYYSNAIKKIELAISQGTKLSDNLELYPKLFPPLLVRLIRVGEVSGKFEDSFSYLADFYEGEVDNATKSLTTLLEPVLLLLIGLVVAALALSIITPIYQITGGLNR